MLIVTNGAAIWRFYESSVPDEVTDLTWRRILDPEAPIHGLCAVDVNSRLLGIVHFFFHPVTSAAGPRCYLEDLFTAKDGRGRGVGRALIEAVYVAATRVWRTRSNGSRRSSMRRRADSRIR